MKKYLIIVLLFFFTAGAYYVSGFSTTYFSNENRDTIITGKSGISNEEVLPNTQIQPENKNTKCCKCKCKCKCKCSNKEVPVGENPYLNNNDTSTNRIQPQEEK
jgi:hypothetical protein